jgi:diguanylate cyclase (GGDEF)-like protein/PAS domain S-box-containing protein
MNTLLFAYLAIGIIVSFFVSIYALSSPVRGRKPFAVACLLSTFWMYAEMIKQISSSSEIRLQSEILRYSAAILIPLFLFTFVNEYFNRKLSRKIVFLLSIVPSISITILLTNPYHYLFFKQIHLNLQNYPTLVYGPYYWFIHFPYSYSLMAGVLVLTLNQLKKAPRNERKPILALFISFCIPLLMNVLAVFRVFGEISLTAFSFPLFFLIIAFAIFRYNLLKANPIVYEKVFNSMQDGVIVVDANDVIADINPTAAESLGKKTEEFLGKKLEEVFSEWDHLLQKYKYIEDLTDEVQINLKGERRFISVRISPIKNENDILEGRVFILRDITESKRYEMFLRNLAFQDALTRISNRRKFQEDFELLIEYSRILRKTFSVVYLDIDNFKKINDSLGHSAGDELLKLVAERISLTLRSSDKLARLGGDEFAILLHECNDVDAQQIISRIYKAVEEEPFPISEQPVKISMSIGLANYPKDGSSMKELIKVADWRMYEEKKKKKGKKLKDELGLQANLKI